MVFKAVHQKENSVLFKKKLMFSTVFIPLKKKKSVSGNSLHSIHVQFVEEKRLNIPILSYKHTYDNNSSCTICLLKFCFIIVSAMRDKHYNSCWFEVIIWISIFLRQNGIMNLKDLEDLLFKNVTKKYDDVIFEG